MGLIVLIIVLVLVFGGGGGYYGYRRFHSASPRGLRQPAPAIQGCV